MTKATWWDYNILYFKNVLILDKNTYKINYRYYGMLV